MKKIFKRFGKIERKGERLEFLDMRGSGLGLFISKEVVQSHGGTISAQSEGRGEGSTFTITLPVNEK